jgi:hypothetical protein
MFSIFKKNKSKTEVPKWASFFNEDEFEEFVKSIDDYFYSNNITYNFGDGMLTAGPNDFEFGTLGLMNVAQICKQDEIENYKEIVKKHFDSLMRTNQFDKEFKKIIHDFNQIKEYIGVRLYPIDYVSHIGKELTIGKDFAGNIYAMLIFDLPDSVVSIKPEEAEKWGKTWEELFDLGLQNIKTKYPNNISQEKFNEFNLWFIQSNHFFTPNIVFDFEMQQKLMGSNGSLIGIPHRHAVIIYSIENIQVVNAINDLITAIIGMNEEGPGSISSNIFWYKDGHYEDLPYEMSDNKIQFYPPEKFVEMLNTLQPNE